MSRITILHTNDIHGRIDGLTRIATLVSQIRAQSKESPVLCFDVGDSEEYASRLSNLTKGVAMHRLLAAAGCDGTVVGNAIMARYGPKLVTEQTAATAYPHLLANVRFADGRLIPGTEAATMIQVGQVQLGLVGLTSEMFTYERFFDLQMMPTIPVLKKETTNLRDAGADAAILLSHMGLDADREIAAAMQDDLALILGSHSHHLLPEGEWVGDVLIAQAGEYAQHLGRVELEWDGRRLSPRKASVIPITESVRPSVEVQAMVAQIEGEVQEHLGEIICHLPSPLEYATDGECGLGNLLADALRHRTRAEIGLAVPGPVFTERLPAGPLSREALWSNCPSTANPGVADLSGAQLMALVERGLDPEFAADKHQAMRGHARGFMHVSGARVRDGQLIVNGQAIEPDRRYRVAASDFEFEPVWGYADEAWQLAPHYEVDVILRELLDDYLVAQENVSVEMGRLG